MAWKDMKAAFYTRRSLGAHGALVRRQSRWVVSCGGRSAWSNGALPRPAITQRGAPCTRSLFFVAPRHVSDLGGPYSTQGDDAGCWLGLCTATAWREGAASKQGTRGGQQTRSLSSKAEELKEFAVVLASKSPPNRPPITTSSDGHEHHHELLLVLLLLLVLRRESLSSSSCLCVRLSISLHQVLRRSLLSLEVTVCPTHIDIALLLPITQTPPSLCWS